MKRRERKKSMTRRMARGATLATAATFGPSAVATIARSITLKRREVEAEKRELEEGCRYPSLPSGDPSKRNMDDLMEELRAIPFNPKPYNGMVSTLMFSTPDQIPMLIECRRRTSGLVYKYPSPFKKVLIESEDGTPLQAVVAIHRDGRSRPALIMVHGIFGSKNHWFSQQVVLGAHYGWGYNVMAIDLRMFGESKLYSDAPGTGGWKEGQDVIAAAKYLKAMDEVTSVAVMGGSYGGAAALCAAYQGEPKDLLDGGIISFCGFCDVERQVRYISTAPKPWDPFFPVYVFFQSCFMLTQGEIIGDMFKYGDFVKYIKDHAAPYYGVTADELYHNSSTAFHIDRIEVPVLEVHSMDDPVVPSVQADILEEKTKDNPNVAVLRTPKGGHCGFATVDKPWMSQLVRTFYNYWATPGEQAKPKKEVKEKAATKKE